MKEVRGDLIRLALEGEFDVIAHGCNCFCNMGAGIAAQIKHHFPQAYTVDKRTAHGSKAKLGLCSIVQQHGVWIVNAYTQFDFGGGKRNVSYPAIRKCMKFIKNNFSGERIGLPLIGCGLAGGDWERVKNIIMAELHDEDVTIVHFSKKFLP